MMSTVRVTIETITRLSTRATTLTTLINNILSHIDDRVPVLHQVPRGDEG